MYLHRVNRSAAHGVGVVSAAAGSFVLEYASSWQPDGDLIATVDRRFGFNLLSPIMADRPISFLVKLAAPCPPRSVWLAPGRCR
jgi:hypothetical protein